VGLRPPRPARGRRDARAGRRRLADVHAADAPRPARPPEPCGPGLGPRRAAGVARRTAAAAPLPAPRRRRPRAARAAPGARAPARTPDAPAADRGRGARRPAVPLAALTWSRGHRSTRKGQLFTWVGQDAAVAKKKQKSEAVSAAEKQLKGAVKK